MSEKNWKASPFLCLGQNVWGRGYSIREAKRNAHPDGTRPVVVYYLPPEIRESIEVHEVDGGLSWSSASDEDGKRLEPVPVFENRPYHAARIRRTRKRLGIEDERTEVA